MIIRRNDEGRGERWRWAFFSSLLVIGAFSAISAASAGLYAEPTVMVAGSVRVHLLEDHEDLMLWTTSFSIVLAFWAIIARPFPRRGRVLFLLLFLAMLVIMSFGADYGARMVYDYNAGGEACQQPIEFTK